MAKKKKTRPRRKVSTRKTVSRKVSRKKRATRRAANPNQKTLIGNLAEKLFYKGGKGKPAGSRWVHEFETPVRVYGMPDGSVKLEPVNKGVRLWDYFDVEV